MANLTLDVASKCDITYRRNNTFKFDIEAKDGAGDDINFTGFTAKMQFKDGLTGTVLQTYTQASGITLTTGNIAINLGTLALDKQELKYDLQLTSAGGEVTTYIYGKLIEVEDITT